VLPCFFYYPSYETPKNGDKKIKENKTKHNINKIKQVAAYFLGLRQIHVVYHFRLFVFHGAP